MESLENIWAKLSATQSEQGKKIAVFQKIRTTTQLTVYWPQKVEEKISDYYKQVAEC